MHRTKTVVVPNAPRTPASGRLLVCRAAAAILVAASAAYAADGVPPPASPPAPSTAVELPWWRVPGFHTGQEDLFLQTLSETYGPAWTALPDWYIGVLWVKFSSHVPVMD